MTTATKRKTSLESRHLCNCGYLTIIPFCSQYDLGEVHGSWTAVRAIKLNAEN